MRRSIPVLSLAFVVCLAVASPAAATGPSSTWTHLGTNGSGGSALNGHVYEMLTTPGGVYFGGIFSNAGGNANADRIARFDGTNWSSVGTGFSNGAVFAIAFHGGKVYAGGNFTDVGGDTTFDYLAVFDGTTWAPFCKQTAGAAFDLQVNALQLIGSIMYVGGTFQNANGVAAADYLVGCNVTTGAMTTTTQPGGMDFTGPVNDLAATADGKLYAGGNFSDLDGATTADRVAWYDGTWHGLDATDIGGIVRGLHAKGNVVYVSSDGLNIGGIAQADHLVKWNGTSYSAIGANSAGTDGYFPSSAFIYELTTFGSLLFASGSWQNANGDPTGDMLAYYDGSAWRPIGSNGAGNGAMNANTEALAVYRHQLYAGGGITSAGGDPLAHFAASRSVTLPDFRVGGAPAGPFTGNDVYNKTGAGQVRAVTVPRNSNVAAWIDIQNDGLSPASFQVRGNGGSAGASATYFDGPTNVTVAVTHGRFRTALLAPGARHTLRIVVKASPSAGTFGTFLVRATLFQTFGADAVKFVVTSN